MIIALNGFLQISYFPIAFQYVPNVAPNVGEALTTGLINFLAHLFGAAHIIWIAIMSSKKFNAKDPESSEIYRNQYVEYIIFSFISQILVGFMLMIFVKHRKRDVNRLVV